MNDAPEDIPGFMSCPCGRGDYDLCALCPYDWCPWHGYSYYGQVCLIRDEGDYDPDYEAELYRRQIPDYDVHFDLDTRKWVCSCPRFVNQGACLHSYRYRGEEVVNVSEDYL